MDRCKVIMLGDQGVGKTKIVRKFIGDESLETDCLTKTVQLDDGEKLKLNILDTAGMERHNSLPSSYYRDACGAIVVYDVANRKSFANAKKWLEEVRQTDENVPVLLIGNYSDKKRQVTEEEAQELANSQNAVLFSETTARNENVDEGVRKLAAAIQKKRKIVSNDSSFRVGKGNPYNGNAAPAPPPSKSGCC
jgi:small GTP-binding protein